MDKSENRFSRISCVHNNSKVRNNQIVASCQTALKELRDSLHNIEIVLLYSCLGAGSVTSRVCSDGKIPAPSIQISTPSLPIVGLQQISSFFCWDWTFLPKVGVDFTSQSCYTTICLSGVLGWLPFLLLGWKYRHVLQVQQTTGKSLQHLRMSTCWATTLGGEVWHPNSRKGSHPNNKFPKKSPFCWIPTQFNNFGKESASHSDSTDCIVRFQFRFRFQHKIMSSIQFWFWLHLAWKGVDSDSNSDSLIPESGLSNLWFLHKGTIIHRSFYCFCYRCAAVTVDTKTGFKAPNSEPLKTLRRYASYWVIYYNSGIVMFLPLLTDSSCLGKRSSVTNWLTGFVRTGFVRSCSEMEPGWNLVGIGRNYSLGQKFRTFKWEFFSSLPDGGVVGVVGVDFFILHYVQS